MNIGEAARRSGVTAKMLRYYEQSGLIPEVARTDAGYRSYTDADVHRLRFVRRARDLGFTVREISELLSLWRDDGRRSAEVKALALGHVDALRNKIAELKAMADTLQTLADRCSGDDKPNCPILADLESENDRYFPKEAKTFGSFGSRHR